MADKPSEGTSRRKLLNGFTEVVREIRDEMFPEGGDGPVPHITEWGYDSDALAVSSLRFGGRGSVSVRLKVGMSDGRIREKLLQLKEKIAALEAARAEAERRRAQEEKKEAARRRGWIRTVRVAFGGDPDVPLPKDRAPGYFSNDDLVAVGGGGTRIKLPDVADPEARAAMIAEVDSVLRKYGTRRPPREDPEGQAQTPES